jgi:branched-subunit amino acid aminotransferase/4-amino-4-deoxychorismate lyase
MSTSMLWTDGRLLPDDALRVSVRDRTFEHGLGLFETLRTWGGHATLLGRHLDRLRNSAEALGLPLAGVALPGPADVAALLRVDGRPGDAALRITLSGGLHAQGGAALWMRARDLTAGPPTATIRESLPVPADDPLARHKTLNYWARRLAHERALRSGADEILLRSESPAASHVWEGSRTNLFVVRDGILRTPPLDGPVLPGVMRAVVIEWAGRLDIPAYEDAITPTDLALASEAFLTNSGRGIWPVSHLLGRDLPAPGPLTTALWGAILPWLEAGGDGP